jgi:hypothetical protein
VTPDSEPTRARRRRRIGLALLLVAGTAAAAAFAFREPLLDEWRLWQFRRAAAAGDPDLAAHKDRLVGRFRAYEEKWDMAARLAHDPDPNVRAAAVDVLLTDQPRAQKHDAVPGLAAVGETTSWRIRVEDAVKDLLQDADPAVRRRALQAVSELEWAGLFANALEAALESGPPEARAVVAEGLAHWNGTRLWRTVGDPNQPDAVRLAALRGLDRYGDRQIASARDKLETALQAAGQSENPELRRAALVAFRHAARPAFAWLDVLGDERRKDEHALVLRTWIDALGTEAGRDRHWFDTHEAWRHADPAIRRATATYVLCEAARLRMQQLDQAPPVAEPAALQDRQGPTGRAFDGQLVRLENILSAVSAVHWYCVTESAADPVFTAWLPHEVAHGAPPRRKLKAYLFQQVKPVWEWCLARRDAYPTRFLPGDDFHLYIKTPGPVAVRPLGAVMDDLLSIGETEFQMLRDRYRDELERAGRD